MLSEEMKYCMKYFIPISAPNANVEQIESFLVSMKLLVVD